jgi:hypothetical protein
LLSLLPDHSKGVGEKFPQIFNLRRILLLYTAIS